MDTMANISFYMLGIIAIVTIGLFLLGVFFG
jgi:hypothetical protein